MYKVIRRETNQEAFCPFINGACNYNCNFFSAHEHLSEIDYGTHVCLLIKDRSPFYRAFLEVKEMPDE